MKSIGLLSGLTALLLAGSAVAQEQKTLVNQKYGFQVSYPADWNVERTMHHDPFPKLEDFKAGRASQSGGVEVGGDAPKPEDWNAAWFNQIRTGPPPGVPYSPSVPSILVYAHPAARGRSQSTGTPLTSTKDKQDPWTLLLRYRPFWSMRIRRSL